MGFSDTIAKQQKGEMTAKDEDPLHLSVSQDERRWSEDFGKSTPLCWSLRSRLIEEYAESESLIEFAKKTILVLMKTSLFSTMKEEHHHLHSIV